MNKKHVAAAGVVIAIAIAVGLWKMKGSASSEEHADKGKAADEEVTDRSGFRAPVDPRAEAVDPRTKARGSLAGTIKDDAGNPITGATACANISSAELSADDTREPICVDADSDGGYRFVDLVEASYEIVGSAPKHIPRTYEDANERTWLRLAAGEQRDGLDIVLKGGAVEATGIVNDINGGPVANALVSVASGRWWGRSGVYTRTADDGTWSAWVAEGSVWANASADGYSDATKQGIAPGQTIEILLTPESVLAGRVVHTGTDEPVPGARVTVGNENWGWNGGEGSSDGSAITDAEGRFRITRVGPGRYKPSARTTAAYGEARQSVMLGLGETRDDVVIEVHAAFVVTGTIVIADEDDKPCDRGWVQLFDADHNRRVSASSKEDGSVHIKAVLPGTYKVSASCDDYLEEDTYPEIEVTDSDVLDQRWEVKSGAGIIGRVIDSQGAPVVEANVRARVTGGDPRGQRSWGWDETDDDGAFEMKGMVAGGYNMTVHANGYPDPKEPTKIEVTAGETTEIELTVESGGEIHGTVVDEEGTPVAGVDVSAVGETWSWGDETTTKDDGTFELEGVRAGDVRVTARRGWSATLRTPGKTDDDVQGERVTVAAGQVATVELVVESQSGEITGSVRDENGKPVGDAFVSATRESDSAGANNANRRRSTRWTWGKKPVLTDTEGGFTLTDLSDGTYTVRAYRRGGGEAFAEGVKVGTHATLTIKRTGSISGTVALDDGAFPDEFTIAVNDRKVGFNRSEKFFRTKGTWTMDDLPAGDFTVSVSAAEGMAKQELSLTEGEDKSGLAFTLESRATVTGTVVSLDGEQPIPGMMITIEPVKGADDGVTIRWGDGDDDKEYITDAQGKFTVKRAPAGKVYVTVFPMNWEDSEYSFQRVIRTIPGGATFHAGTIKLPSRRVKPRERGGDLGIDFKEGDPDTEPEDYKLEVSFVRPDGPAVDSGIEVGDVVTSVDGHDVTGENIYLYFSLAQVPEGTTIELGLERDATVSITAAAPL